MTTEEKVKYLIIGNSAGGIGAVEAIREVDKAGAITIVSDEPYPAYSRPLISNYLAEGYPLERMLFRPPDFYEKNNIQAVLGQKVTELNVEKHAIKLEGNRTIIWDKLLLATGSLPIIPAINGLGLKGVFTFSTLDDAKAIDQFLKRYDGEVRAVVIGGGLIGVSATTALVKRGVDVTVVEMKERILNTVLDEEGSTLVAASLKQSGVDIITGNTVTGVSNHAPGETAGVTIDDGRQLSCEMVIVAIGVRPRVELVPESKINMNRGIIVDRHMATSSPDVYACGDVAEAHDFVYDQNRLTLIWPNAYAGGRVAGFNMAGSPTIYQGGTAINSIKYVGASIVSAGIVATPDDRYEVISHKDGHVYKKVVLRDGLIVGLVFSGDIERSGIVYNLMKERVDVDSFKEVLIADDFGLASLPENIWRARLATLPPESTLPPTSGERPEKMLVGE
ncbi:MAG: FAD-dependent oxidoreductase [Dehalococcoidia bacterium]